MMFDFCVHLVPGFLMRINSESFDHLAGEEKSLASFVQDNATGQYVNSFVVAL
jgi:hypothetical protein